MTTPLLAPSLPRQSPKTSISPPNPASQRHTPIRQTLNTNAPPQRQNNVADPPSTERNGFNQLLERKTRPPEQSKSAEPAHTTDDDKPNPSAPPTADNDTAADTDQPPAESDAESTTPPAEDQHETTPPENDASASTERRAPTDHNALPDRPTADAPRQGDTNQPVSPARHEANRASQTNPQAHNRRPVDNATTPTSEQQRPPQPSPPSERTTTNAETHVGTTSKDKQNASNDASLTVHTHSDNPNGRAVESGAIANREPAASGELSTPESTAVRTVQHDGGTRWGDGARPGIADGSERPPTPTEDRPGPSAAKGHENPSKPSTNRLVTDNDHRPERAAGRSRLDRAQDTDATPRTAVTPTADDGAQQKGAEQNPQRDLRAAVTTRASRRDAQRHNSSEADMSSEKRTARAGEPAPPAIKPAPNTSAVRAPEQGGQAPSQHNNELQPQQQRALHASVTRGLNAALNQKGGSLMMRLVPESLGQMRIHMSIAEGRVSVDLQTSTQQAHRALTQQLASLRGALEQRGYRVEALKTTLNAAMLRSGGAEAAQQATTSQQANQQPAQQQGYNAQGGGQGRGEGHTNTGDGRSRGSFEHDGGSSDRREDRDRGEERGAHRPAGFGEFLDAFADGEDAA